MFSLWQIDISEMGISIVCKSQTLSDSIFILMSRIFEQHHEWNNKEKEIVFTFISMNGVHSHFWPWFWKAFITHTEWIDEIVFVILINIFSPIFIMFCHIDILTCIFNYFRRREICWLKLNELTSRQLLLLLESLCNWLLQHFLYIDIY